MPALDELPSSDDVRAFLKSLTEHEVARPSRWQAVNAGRARQPSTKKRGRTTSVARPLDQSSRCPFRAQRSALFVSFIRQSAFCTLRVVHSPQRTQRAQRGHRGPQRRDSRSACVLQNSRDARQNALADEAAGQGAQTKGTLNEGGQVRSRCVRCDVSALCPLCVLCVLCGESGRIAQNPMSSMVNSVVTQLTDSRGAPARSRGSRRAP
jgi:hypothetical protein